jgi:AraC-like DNA-binding protein
MLVGLMLLGLMEAHAAKQSEYYFQLQKMPTEKLLNLGSNYAEITAQADSALACFTIVTSRYRKGLPDKEMRQIVAGYIGKWYVYFFCYFDYSKAFESLSKAEELARKFPDITPRIYLNFGCMYQTLAEQGKDVRQDSLALDYYRKAFKLAKDDQSGIIDMVFSNIITVCYSMDRMESIKKEWQQYSKLPIVRGSRRYNHGLYKGLLLMSQHRYANAEQEFRKQQKGLPIVVANVRYRYVAFTNIARAQAAQGHYADAIVSLDSALQIARQDDMKDAKLEVYDLLADYYRKLNDNVKAEEYRYSYFRVKDTLLNYHQLMSVNEMRFVNKMKQIDEQMQANEHKRQMQQVVIWVVVVIALIVAVSLFVVWRNNKKLRLRNASLYLKTVSMLQAEEEAKRRREELEAQVKTLSEKPQPFGEEKYKSSNLAQDNKEELMGRIRQVMENCEEIYAPGFSTDRLAQLTDSNYKYVSQVINETCNCNFSNFLNEYRIKEACRRINDDPRYANLTIEAISSSVGFRSRSTFVNAFKRFTGLTPSEYLRIAKEQKEA